MLSPGSPSSSAIVPVALAVPSVAFVCSLSVTVNSSWSSLRVSSAVATLTVFAVSPAVNVSVVADTAV